jgi:molecular chaperone GrpE
LIHEKLKAHLLPGLEQVDLKGRCFDADAEAITQIPAPSDEFKGKIVDVLEKDTIGDKIIRSCF